MAQNSLGCFSDSLLSVCFTQGPSALTVHDSRNSFLQEDKTQEIPVMCVCGCVYVCISKVEHILIKKSRQTQYVRELSE